MEAATQFGSSAIEPLQDVTDEPHRHDNESPREIQATTGCVGLLLDAINFLFADIHGALGLFVNIYLITEKGWSQSETGLLASVGGWVGLLVQMPCGTLIDECKAKR